MRILPEPLLFEWDEGNIDKNWLLHRVANQEAEEIFFSEPIFIFEDEKHSSMEKRYMIWGETNRARKLTSIFTIRGGRVRIISVRNMHRKERQAYEKARKNTEI